MKTAIDKRKRRVFRGRNDAAGERIIVEAVVRDGIPLVLLRFVTPAGTADFTVSPAAAGRIGRALWEVGEIAIPAEPSNEKGESSP